MEPRACALCFQPVGGIAAGIATCGDHFRNCKRGAEAARQTTHTKVGNPRHGREKRAPIEAQPANLESPAASAAYIISRVSHAHIMVILCNAAKSKLLILASKGKKLTPWVK